MENTGQPPCRDNGRKTMCGNAYAADMVSPHGVKSAVSGIRLYIYNKVQVR